MENGWYIVTTIFNKLGLSDLSSEYECIGQLQNFRKNILENDSKYEIVLEQYDLVGPVIADLLSNDEELCRLMSQTYLTIVLDLIRDKKYDEALELYIHMVNYLIGKYNLNIEDLQKGKGRK